MTDILHRLNTAVYTDSAWGNGTVEVVKDQGLQQHKDTQSHAEGAATYAVCSIPTAEDKPVRLAYGGKDTDIQQHSDTHTYIQQEDTYTGKVIDIHSCAQQEDTCVGSTVGTHTPTHVQQEDTTHVYNTEDTHYYTRTDSAIDTCTDSVVDTHTLTHNDVVYDTQEIDTYIHTAVDTTTLY